jgi:hypothetical protein
MPVQEVCSRFSRPWHCLLYRLSQHSDEIQGCGRKADTPKYNKYTHNGQQDAHFGCLFCSVVINIAKSHCRFDTGSSCHCIRNDEYNPHDAIGWIEESNIQRAAIGHIAIRSSSTSTIRYYSISNTNRLWKQRCHLAHQQEVHPAIQSANHPKLHQRSKQLPNP